MVQQHVVDCMSTSGSTRVPGSDWTSGWRREARAPGRSWYCRTSWSCWWKSESSSCLQLVRELLKDLYWTSAWIRKYVKYSRCVTGFQQHSCLLEPVVLFAFLLMGSWIPCRFTIKQITKPQMWLNNVPLDPLFRGLLEIEDSLALMGCQDRR